MKRRGPLERLRARRRWTLTTREHDYLVGVWDGLSNRQIAERLGVTVPTVKETLRRLGYLSHDPRYVGRFNRIMLIRWAVEEGYIDVWALRLTRARSILKTQGASSAQHSDTY